MRRTNPDRWPVDRGGTDADRHALPHLPALDGLRAIALLAVMAFHAGFGWMAGGYLPLTSFFVLSGFLITALLLRERDRTGRIDLRAFWGRRARRLVPAALLGMGLVAVYIAAAGERVPGIRGDLLASLTWVTNWRFILSDRSYADAFSDPSPLQHLWSLAVEEQFYLVAPVLVAGLLAVAAGRRWVLATGVTALIGASVLVMRAVHDPDAPPLRAYFGTDTRAAELLVGVLLALLLVGRDGLRVVRPGVRRVLDVAGLLALVASVAAWSAVAEYDDRLYRGGLLGIALLAAVVVAAATQPGSWLNVVLGRPLLVAIGRVSYGAYLFHWPVFLWLDTEQTGLHRAPLFAVQLACTFALAVASYHLVEQPVRLRRWLPGRAALVGWANGAVAVAAVVVAITASTVAPAITLRAADAAPPPPFVPTTTTSAPRAPTETHVTATDQAATAAASPGGTRPATAAPDGAGPAVVAPGTSVAPPTTTPPPPPPPPVRVMVVGDSVGQNLATGLTRWSTRTGQLIVFDVTRLGCPTVRGGHLRFPNGDVYPNPVRCESWPRDWAEHVASFRPDVVVLQSALAELNDRRLPEWADYATPGEPAWDDHTLGEYQRAYEVLSGTGARVLWTNAPCAMFQEHLGGFHQDQAEGERRVRYLNEVILSRFSASRPVEVIDFYGQLCPGGRYSDSPVGVPNGRPDGVHLSDVAAEALAERWLGPLVVAAGRR